MTEIINDTYCFSNEATVTWNIHDFMRTMQQLQQKTIPSQEYSIGKATFRLQAFLSISSFEKVLERDYLQVSLFLNCSAGEENPEVDESQKMSYSVALMNKCGKLEYYKIGSLPASPNGRTIFSIRAKELLLRNKDLIPHDILTIHCELFTLCIKQISKMAVNQKAESTSHLDDLSTDMAKLLKEPSTADFIIRIQEKDIPVHSVILCARSSVFKAMLSNEYKEKQKNVVEINDVTSPAMCNFLEYVYTGSLTEPGSMSTDLLMEVYAVADKYNVVKLKDMCAQFLLDKLSEDNMEKFVRIADKHNDHKMLDSIADFVARRQEILDGEKWKRLSENVPTFGFRVLNGVLKRRRLI